MIVNARWSDAKVETSASSFLLGVKVSLGCKADPFSFHPRVFSARRSAGPMSAGAEDRICYALADDNMLCSGRNNMLGLLAP